MDEILRQMAISYPEYPMIAHNITQQTMSGFSDAHYHIPHTISYTGTNTGCHALRHKDLRLVSINVTSINSREKMAKLDLQISSGDYDIICVQETSFDPKLPKNRWGINGYTLMTFHDKTSAAGDNAGQNGGTAIYVRNELVQFCSVFPIPSNFSLAQICAIKFDKIFLVNVYRSPNQLPDEAIRFAEFLQDNLPRHSMFLCGDFNLSEIDYVERTAKKKEQRAFAKMFENLNLIQHITDATNPTSGNVLDLFLTYDNSKIKTTFVDYTWTTIKNNEVKSLYEHYPIIVEFSSRPDYQAFEMKRDFFNVDVTKFRRLFKNRKVGQNYAHRVAHYKIVEDGLFRRCVCGTENCKLDRQCACGEKHNIEEEIEARHKEIAEAVRECYDEACPMKKVFHYSESKNRFSSKTLKQKRRIDALKRNGNTEFIMEEQLLLEEYVNDDLEQETKNMIQFWSKHKNNVYQTIKRTKKMTSKSEGIYRDVDNGDLTIVYEDDEKVAILVEHSRKVLKDTNAFGFNWDDHFSEDDAAPFPSRHWLPSISEEIVEYYIDYKIKDKHSIGSCGTSSHMIKLLSDLISRPLTILYQLMYVSRYTPLDHRTSKIVYIPKKSDNLANPHNLRGLNVISPIYLPMEYVLCSHQYRHLEESHLFSPWQFGMRRTLNTELNLVHFNDFITKTEINCAGQVLLFTDYRKAFDVINHEVLMSDLNDHRFHPHLGKFFQNWFGDSHQFVQVNNTRSYTIPCKSSVKQGSVIAGLFSFNLVINGLFDYMKKKADELGLGDQFYIASYCDDTKMAITLKKNKSFQGQLDLIQMLIDSFYEWTLIKKLPLNKDKCVCLIRHMKKSDREKVSFMLDDQPFKVVDTEIDLGVVTTTVPNGLKHFKKQTGVATRVINSIKHIIPRLTYSTQLMLWNSLVRSVCIYGSHYQYPFSKAERSILRKTFRRYWGLCAKPPDNARKPITILQFMLIKDLKWMKNSTHKQWPHSFVFDPEEINMQHIRRQSIRNYGKTFPENGLEAMSFSIQRLKKRRRESLRYRHTELYQSLPIEIIQTDDINEFKMYCIENVIDKYDDDDNKMVNDLMSGTLRVNYLKKLKIQFELRKLKELEDNESESDSSDTE